MQFDRPPERAPKDILGIPTWVHRTGRELYTTFLPELYTFLDKQKPNNLIIVSGSIMENRKVPVHHEEIIGCQHYVASELEEGLLVASHPDFLKSLSFGVLDSGQWAFEKHYIGIDLYLRLLQQDISINSVVIGSEDTINAKLFGLGSREAYNLIEGEQPGGAASYLHGFSDETVYLAVGAKKNATELRCKLD
jgi:hypothetical protein